jgi:hypothetical protein
LLLGLAVIGQASAATPPNRGIAISPAYGELTIPKDQPALEHFVTLVNRSEVEQRFNLSLVDFGSLDETGGVAFLGAPASELEHKYGLASWMKLSSDSVTLKAGASERVRVMIDNRESLAPGGHYGAVMATAQTATDQAVGKPKVGVKQVLSSLILLVKDGGSADLRLLGQKGNGAWFKLPNSVEQRYQNIGSVHAVPRGVVAVKDPRGKVVRRGALNEGSGAVLPDSYRRFQTGLIDVGGAWLPGRYTIATSYRHDGTEKTTNLVTSMWYAGAWWLWVAVFAFIALVVAGVKYGRRLKWRPKFKFFGARS